VGHENYPLAEVVQAEPKAAITKAAQQLDDQETIDPWAELQALGYHLSPELMLLSPEERTVQLRTSLAQSLVDLGPSGGDYPADTEVRQIKADAPALQLLGIPAYTKSKNRTRLRRSSGPRNSCAPTSTARQRSGRTSSTRCVVSRPAC
jgi:hypothetical protein